MSKKWKIVFFLFISSYSTRSYKIIEISSDFLIDMWCQLRYTEKNRESFGEWLVWLKISRKLGKLPINWTVNKKS